MLIQGSLIFTGGDEILRDGYVYISGGKVVEVGEGQPPEDYTYANLVLGGRGRIIAPALVAATDITLYPVRLWQLSKREKLNYYKNIPANAQAIAAMPGVYELHMSGAGTIIVESSDPRVTSHLEDMYGGEYHMADVLCEDRGVFNVPEFCGGNVEGLYLREQPSYMLIGRSSVYEESVKLAKSLGLPIPAIREGAKARIAVFDTFNPPAMFLYERPDLASRVYEYLSVESLLVGENVLVDINEHLSITDNDLSNTIDLLNLVKARRKTLLGYKD